MRFSDKNHIYSYEYIFQLVDSKISKPVFCLTTHLSNFFWQWSWIYGQSRNKSGECQQILVANCSKITSRVGSSMPWDSLRTLNPIQWDMNKFSYNSYCSKHWLSESSTFQEFSPWSIPATRPCFGVWAHHRCDDGLVKDFMKDWSLYE